MAYIYVKSGGTATGTAGKYGTQKTGSWSTAFTATSQYYSDLAYALANSSPSNGDYILVSDIHDYQYSSTGVNVSYSTSILVYVTSVDDDDVTVPSVGAKETCTDIGSRYMYFYLPYLYGMEFSVTSTGTPEIRFENPSNTSLWSSIIKSCDFSFNFSASVDINLGSLSNVLYSSVYFFKDCSFTQATGYLTGFNTRFGLFHFINCSFISPSSTTIPWINEYSLNGTGNIILRSCDFSQSNRLIFNCLTTSPGPFTFIKVINCELLSNSIPSSYIGYLNNCYPSSVISSNYNSIINEYYYSGSVTSNTSIYRINGASINDVNSSLKIVTRAENTNYGNVLRFKLSDFIADTSSSRIFIVHIALSNTSVLLSDTEAWIELAYSDDSTSLGHFQTTEKLPFSQSAFLEASGATWTGITNPYKQKLVITTNQTGSSGLCTVWLNIRTTTSKTFYVCPKVDVI
jgi:hypothetical protein